MIEKERIVRELNFANFLIVTGLYSTLKVSQWKRRNSLCIYWRVMSGGVWTVFACSGKSRSDCAIKKKTQQKPTDQIYILFVRFLRVNNEITKDYLFYYLSSINSCFFRKKGNSALLFKFRFSRPFFHFSRYRASFLLFNLRSMFDGCFGGFFKSLSEVLTRKSRTFYKCVCVHLSAHGPSLCCANLKIFIWPLEYEMDQFDFQSKVVPTQLLVSVKSLRSIFVAIKTSTLEKMYINS